jgi:hypothetical protein
MTTIQKLKIATIISFLIIVFPDHHVTFLNIMSLGITFLQPFFMIGVDPIGIYDVQVLLISGLTILSLILIFKKSRILTLACIAIQYLWLINSFSKKNLNEIIFLSTVGLYIILSIILFIYVLKNRKHKLNSH